MHFKDRSHEHFIRVVNKHFNRTLVPIECTQVLLFALISISSWAMFSYYNTYIQYCYSILCVIIIFCMGGSKTKLLYTGNIWWGEN